MDNTLTAVLIGAAATLGGSLLTFLGNYLSHVYTLKREEKKWEREIEAEEKKWNRDKEQTKGDRELARKEQITSTYQDCIHNLSLLSAKEPKNGPLKIHGEKRLQLIEEAQKSLALLSLRNGGNDYYFNDELRKFTTSPDEYAQSLRERVIQLAVEDEVVMHPVNQVARLRVAC
jgi:hypothetical protein